VKWSSDVHSPASCRDVRPTQQACQAAMPTPGCAPRARPQTTPSSSSRWAAARQRAACADQDTPPEGSLGWLACAGLRRHLSKQNRKCPRTCLQAISSMLQQYGRPSGGYDIGGAAGLDFGGGGPSGADLRATSAGSAFGGGMSQGFQPVRMQRDGPRSAYDLNCFDDSSSGFSRTHQVWSGFLGRFGYGPLQTGAPSKL
jgi:hypothetical protein